VPAEPGAAPGAEDAPPATDGKIMLGDIEVTPEELTDLRARAAADATRKATITSPAAFKAELGADWVAPPGIDYRIDEADPLLSRYREVAYNMGLDQAQFSEGLKMVASMRVAEAQAFSQARAAEVTKLGPNAQARVDAAVQFLKAVGGSKASGLVDVLRIAPVAATIVAIEQMQQTFRQGVGSYSQAHRAEPRNDGKIPGYEKMNFAERRFAQDQARTRR
jgi:hypothetical protein